jgi:hypothetical protein
MGTTDPRGPRRSRLVDKCTVLQAAVLKIVLEEMHAHGQLKLSIRALASAAHVSPTTVKTALKLAAIYGGPAFSVVKHHQGWDQQPTAEISKLTHTRSRR